MYLLGILYRFQRNIFIIKELLIDLEKRGWQNKKKVINPPWSREDIHFIPSIMIQLRYWLTDIISHYLILHSHLEHFDDLSFFGAILVTRNIFLKPNFTQFSPTHFFSLKKPSRFFWRLSIGLLWLFFSRSRNLTSSFSRKKIDFFFHGRIHIDPKWIS